MKLREITVKNFRCLADITVPVCDTTVLVGENNSGKTAFLDALRFALPPSSSGRMNPFDDYDYHMIRVDDSPQSSDGIVIELWFREDAPDEWPESLVQALTEIIQTEPSEDLDSIGLRLSSRYDQNAGEIIPKWEFLTLDGQPLGGKGSESRNLARFLPYIRCFYLPSLRDSTHEFSARSQFWGRILRSLNITAEQRKSLSDSLTQMNEQLLKADPRLEQVRATLEKSQEILELGARQRTSIQALPLKPWDLMSKAEVAIKAHGSEVDFPLARHGQGVQSMAVLFLLQAYIDVLLKPTFQPETEAILALEEPETHLHPQAARALAATLDEVKSQKVISSHSCHFIQEVPLTQLRMFRRHGPSSKVLYVKRSFTAKVPGIPSLLDYCAKNQPIFSYHQSSETLEVRGKLEQKQYRDLLTLYSADANAQAVLRRTYTESQIYLEDWELSALETYIKRIRGEALFARGWLLCEGQSEYQLLRYFAEISGTPLDRAGVTVIDFQNNGSPSPFVKLGQTFDIPWIMACDSDDAGKSFVKQAQESGLAGQEVRQGFEVTTKAMTKMAKSVPPDVLTGLENLQGTVYKTEQDFLTAVEKAAGPQCAATYRVVILECAEIRPLARLLPEEGADLELFLLHNGFAQDFETILEARARASHPYATEWAIAGKSSDTEKWSFVSGGSGGSEIRVSRQNKPDETIGTTDSRFENLACEVMAAELRKDKVRSIEALVDHLRATQAGQARIPHFFQMLIQDIIEKAAL